MAPAPSVRRKSHRTRRDLEIRAELLESEAVDLALEIDHGFERHPVVVPAPRVEFRMAARAQADVAIAPGEAQQEPDLLLALVGAAPFALHPMRGNVVVQPIARAPEDLHVVRLEPSLF